MWRVVVVDAVKRRKMEKRMGRLAETRTRGRTREKTASSRL